MTGTFFPVIVEVNSTMEFHKSEDALRMALVLQSVLKNPNDVKVFDGSPYTSTEVDGENVRAELVPTMSFATDRSGYTTGRQEAEAEGMAVVNAFRKAAGLSATVEFEPVLTLDDKIRRWTVDYAGMVANAAEIPGYGRAEILAIFRAAVAEAHANMALRGISLK